MRKQLKRLKQLKQKKSKYSAEFIELSKRYLENYNQTISEFEVEKNNLSQRIDSRVFENERDQRRIDDIAKQIRSLWTIVNDFQKIVNS